jgi:hypothetical protein
VEDIKGNGGRELTFIEAYYPGRWLHWIWIGKALNKDRQRLEHSMVLSIAGKKAT